MKKIILFLATILGSISLSAQVTTRIEGTVSGDSPTEGMMLFGEFNQDFRIKPAVEIPIKDGRFSYEWTAKDSTAYNFCFKDEYKTGSWREYTVFSEGGTLHIAVTFGDAGAEVGDEFQVWQQMGAGNAGGALFLLDSKGKILMTNPTAEDVREYLKTHL